MTAAPTERDERLVDAIAGDEGIGDDEDGDRDRLPWSISVLSAAASSRDAVMTPCSWPSFITAISGLRNFAISAATSMMVSSALCRRDILEMLGQHVADRLAGQLLGGLVGP